MSGNESLIRAKKDEYERFSSAMDIHPKWERCWVTGDQEVDWERVIGARGNSDRGFKTILQNIAGDDKMKLRGSEVMSIRSPIQSPIEQRNTAKGNPNAILMFDRPLNNRQQRLLDSLPLFNSQATVRKRDANLYDLAALTAKTGDEFALFTKNGERLIIRGDSVHVDVTLDIAQSLADQGYRWSGHTHPGIDFLSTQPSDGDYAILSIFRHARTVISNSKGQIRLIERRE